MLIKYFNQSPVSILNRPRKWYLNMVVAEGIAYDSCPGRKCVSDGLVGMVAG